MLLCCAHGLTGCGRDAAGPQDHPAERSDAVAPGPGAAELQRLRNLGYVDVVEDERELDARRAGVEVIDAERVSPGANLYTQRSAAEAVLMDAQGEVLRRWRDPQARQWSRARLLPGGDLVAVGNGYGAGAAAGPEGRRFVVRLGPHGALRWRRLVRAHHEIQPLPNGRLATLTMDRRRLPEVGGDVPVRDDYIQLLGPDGTLGERASLYELLTSGPHAVPIQPVAPSDGRSGDVVDLVHANSLVPFDAERLRSLVGTHPIYADSSLLVTSRHQDVIAVVDWKRREVIHAWGRGVVSGPHDATWLENGHWLVFDNGLGRGWSRVLEVDPLDGDIVWEYRAPEATDFYTAARGSAQRLPNGNTLITHSGAGEAFEVDAAGEPVWRFLNPARNPRGKRWALGRMYRYPPDFLARNLGIEVREP